MSRQTPSVILQPDGSKIHLNSGHKFKAIAFNQPTVCSICHKLIYGVGKQGYKCLCCEKVVHKRCHSSVMAECKLGEISGNY